VTTNRKPRAQAAAATVAAQYGLSSTDIRLLDDSNNTVMLLHPESIVAKVATGHHQRLALELDVAERLYAHHGPVVPPARWPPPQVHTYDGLQMTFWQFIHPEPGESEPTMIADALHELHRLLSAYPGSLPSFDAELNAVSKVLTDPHQAKALPDEDRAFLYRALQRLRGDLRQMQWTARPLHGSPSTGNQIKSGGLLRFIDFETASLGPLEWDLAHLGDEVVSLYPSTFDEEILHICRGLVSVKTSVWCWANYGHPDLSWHARHHLQVVKAMLGS
jgi:hypothetical protein